MLKGRPLRTSSTTSASPESYYIWYDQLAQVLSLPMVANGALRFHHIKCIEWTELSRSICKSRVALRSLSFTFCQFSTLDEFDQLITSFKSLSSLWLDSVSFGPFPVLPARPLHGLGDPSFSRIRIGRQCSVETLVPWLVNCTDRASNLLGLEVDEITTRQGIRIRDSALICDSLMSFHAHSLRYLKIGCCFDVSPWHSMWTWYILTLRKLMMFCGS